MRKLVSILLTLAVAVSLMVVPAMVSADGPPTIDGAVSPVDEWVGATEILTLDGVSTVSVMADTDYVYVLFQVVDSTDARIPGENIHGNDQTSININPTPGATNWGMPCDIIFQTGADPAAWGGTSSGTTDGWETDWEIDGIQEMSLPVGLETMTIYSGGTRISEWKLPLASIDGLSAGDILDVGGTANVGDGESYCYPVDLNSDCPASWGDLSIYVDILVQGNTSVGLTAKTPTITAINVDPTSLDFGTVMPGDTVSGQDITVCNIGTVTVDVDAYLNPLTGTVFNYLKLGGVPSGGNSGDWNDYIINGLKPGECKPPLTTQLVVPSYYSAQGPEAAILIFEAAVA